MADEVQNAVMLAFNQTISEDHLKKSLERTNLPDNCKVAQKTGNFFNSFSCNQEHRHKIKRYPKGLFQSDSMSNTTVS